MENANNSSTALYYIGFLLYESAFLLTLACSLFGDWSVTIMKSTFYLAAIFFAITLIPSLKWSQKSCHQVEKIEQYHCSFEKHVLGNSDSDIKISCTAKYSSFLDCKEQDFRIGDSAPPLRSSASEIVVV